MQMASGQEQEHREKVDSPKQHKQLLCAAMPNA
jgi:hypothetical protein